MRRSIRSSFENGTLTPQSELIELKHIGSYLYRRLQREFSPNHTLTIKRFANKIQNLSLHDLKHRIHKALQNLRKNECIATNSGLHHVQDVNEKGYETIINLIKVLANNEDGHNLGRNFRFEASRLRKPPKRHDITKAVSCKKRNECLNANETWNNGLCKPSNNSIKGFSGIYPFSGQKTYKRNNRYVIGSIRNSRKHGKYSHNSNTNVMWRRPGKLRKL